MPNLELRPSQEQMDANQEELRANNYPGRVLITGLSTTGLVLQAYALMGRSEGSRNRRLDHEGDNIKVTAPNKTEAEMAETENAALIYYTAMTRYAGRYGDVHIVSNGAQTLPIAERVAHNTRFEDAIADLPEVDGVDLSSYEPDGPNFTPRISAVLDLRKKAKTQFGISVIRKPADSDQPLRTVWQAGLDELEPGVGYGVHTYNGNGDPLPSFDREPFTYPLGRNAMDTASRLWEVLDSPNPDFTNNRVALVVKSIGLVVAGKGLPSETERGVVRRAVFNGPHTYRPL